MSDRHADCRYWELTTLQCIRYHARVSRYWADRSSSHAAEAARLSRLATRWAFVALGILAVSFAMRIVAVALS